MRIQTIGNSKIVMVDEDDSPEVILGIIKEKRKRLRADALFLLDQAGVTNTDIVRICQVHRGTVAAWRDGAPIPPQYLVRLYQLLGDMVFNLNAVLKIVKGKDVFSRAETLYWEGFRNAANACFAEAAEKNKSHKARKRVKLNSAAL